MKRIRIAIVGTGGVGGYIGARLWAAGNDVTFIARGAHLAAMKRDGLKLQSPDGDFVVRATFTDAIHEHEPFDLFIIAVKSFDTQSAAQLIRPTMRDSSVVLSVQNGVENEDVLSDVLGRDHVLTGVAYVFSTIAALGVVRHEGATGRIKFGEMDGGVSERCEMIERLFIRAGIIGETVGNIWKTLWEKWIFICGLGGMTAYAKQSIGEVLMSRQLRKMLEDVVIESTAIARSKDIDEFVGFEGKVMAHCHRLPNASTSSMYYDRMHGKRLEVEALNGAAIRFGRKLNVATPANETIYNELKSFFKIPSYPPK